MRRRIMPSLLAALFAVAGCASTSSVSSKGPTVFTITAAASQARGGEVAARRRVRAGAANQCAKTDQKAQTITETLETPGITDVLTAVTLEFKCF
jgi:hypothetical protein